ncbi:MAG: hypothetical protein ACLF0G_05965 [Candidatus Brocadiia bacterium]
MGRTLRRCVWIVAIGLVGLAVAAQALSVDELIALKQMGYSEEDLRGEIRRTGTKIDLAPADVEKLKAAGISDQTIALLRAARRPQLPARELTLEAIAKMAADGKSVEDILAAIHASDQRFGLTAAQALELSRKRVPLAVILALRGQPLTVGNVEQLAPGRLSPAAWKRLVAILGVENVDLPGAKGLQLMQLGVPPEVVAAFTRGPAPPPPPPPPADGLFSVVTQPAEPGLYRHAGKLFEVRFPPSWRLLRVLQEGFLSYVLTPEPRETNPDRMKVKVELGLIPLEDVATVLAGKDPVSIMKHTLPLLRRQEPGLEPAGEIAQSKLGTLDAATLLFHGTLKDQAGHFTCRGWIAEKDRVVFMLAATAPREAYPQLEATFQKIALDSRFGWPRPKRLERSLEARHVTGKYKESVVHGAAGRHGHRLRHQQGRLRPDQPSRDLERPCGDSGAVRELRGGVGREPA